MRHNPLIRTALLFSAFVALGAKAQAQDTPAPVAPAVPQEGTQAPATTVSLTEHGVAFQVPPGHQQVRREALPPAAQQAIFACIAPRVGEFTTNINLVVLSAPGPQLPDNFAEIITKNVKDSLQEYKVVSQARIKVAGQDAAALSATFRTTKMGSLLRNRQVYIVKGSRLYVWTFTSAAETYTKNVSALEKLLKSLHWLPTPKPDTAAPTTTTPPPG